MKKASGSHFALRAPARRRREPERRRPVQARSQVTVEAILEATIQVLVSDGFAALNTTRVAEVAGVSVGSLYQYFPNKRALVRALLERFIGRLVDFMVAALRAKRQAPLEELVAGMVGGMLAFKSSNLEAALALRAVAAEVDFAPVIRGAERRVAAALALALRRRVREPGRAARVLIAAVDGAVKAALDERPALLRSPAFARELIALAVGYLRTREAPEYDASPR